MRHHRLCVLLTLIALGIPGFSTCVLATGLVFSNLYSFANGASPSAGLTIGSNGQFYGTLATGGPGNNGGLFEVNSNGTLLTNIWFSGRNGAAPLAPLIQDKNGNLYGTASQGGARNDGTVFKITNGFQFQWAISFNNNGATPLAPLLEGTNGSFYGTTFGGGSNSLGTVFLINSEGVLTSLYSFSGGNGANPSAGLIQGRDGNLYGTTQYGGAAGFGTVFQLTYAGALTNLCSFSNYNGAYPGGLIEDSSGNFYGTTLSGGANVAGTIFKISHSGLLSTLFTFGVYGDSTPNSLLVLGNDGYWYGTTKDGGGYNEGTIFRFSETSGLTNLVSFDGTDGALPLSGMATGPDGNFYGTTSQGGSNGFGVIYQLAGFSPFIIKPPKSLSYASNGTAMFSVTAGGSAPLSYQWQFDGTNAANDMPGATNASLVVANERLTNSGTYTVSISNPFGSISATAVLSVPTPAVTIASPPAGARTNNVIVKGTASAFAQVANVYYWVTNVNAGNNPAMTTHSGTATLSANGTTTRTWSISNVFLPGTNFITVQTVDSLGNKSATATRELFCKVTNEFTLRTNVAGLGGITGSASVSGDVAPTNGAMLNIGEGYTLTAHPTNNYALSNWTSAAGIIGTTPTLHFIMESNLAITANFSNNLFIGAAGTYNGLFYQTNDVTEQSAGMLYNMTLHADGTYSATLLLDGASYFIAGSFNTSAMAGTNVSRTPAKGGLLSIEMTLDWTNDEIAGIVSNAAWVSQLEAEKSAVSSNSAAYTVLLAPGTNAPGQVPPGYGYMLITNYKGNVTLSGALADGSTFSQTVPLGVLGDVPVFYNKLYSSTGLLLGWLGLSNGAVQPEGPIAWIKPAIKSGTYTNGFTNNLLPTGSGWTNPPAKASAVSLTNGTLTISNTSFTLEFPVSITNDTVVKVSSNVPTNTLTGTIAPKTGYLTITFGNGAGKSTTTGYGAMLQDSTTGGGYFVTKTNAGSILLTSTPP